MEAQASRLTQGEYLAVLRQDLGSFIIRCFHELNSGEKLAWNWHLEVLASKLSDAAQGRINRLIVTLPPRQLKSICVSVALPAWILGRNPSAKILCASYGQDLADDLARKCLAIATSDWYAQTFPTRIAPSRRAVSDFHTTKRGYRRSASVGGALTGFGADWIIVDDPQKPGEALSDAMRRAANAWFDETLLSRLNDKSKGCIIIVMQRLHEDDLVGHVLAKGEKWDVVNFPAIAETDELFGWTNAFGTGRHLRREGDVLHPEREPREILEGLRRQMGTYLFSAQYQQRPIPREGARINTDWFRRYESVADIKFDRIIQSWDTASKIGELNDYSVCTTWGIKGESIYLLHVFKKRLLTPDLEKALIELCSGWGADRVIVEDHVSGVALVQYLPRRGFHKAEAFTPQGDKAMRMEAHTGMIEYGRVFIPKEAPWLDDYLCELQAFPNGRYDDQVDSTSQALEWINTRGREPGIIGYYRQLHEEKTRAAQAPSGAVIKLRPAVLGTQLQTNGGPTIFPDKDGILHVPERLLDPVTLGTLLGQGWKRVD